MPILIVLLLTASAAKVEWFAPPAGLSPPATLALTAAMTLAPVLLTGVLARWCAAALRRGQAARAGVAARYVRLRRRFGVLNVVALIVVVPFGWGDTVWHAVTFADGTLVPFAELLVPAPYLLAVFASWLLHFDAERELHRTGIDDFRPFWTRASHFGFNLRPFALLVLLPLVLFAAQQSFVRFFPEAAGAPVTQVLALLAVPVMFALLPLAVKPALGLKSMPIGPTRTRLEALAARLKFRCRDLLLWPTHGGVANAMVVGIFAPARYVVFTDKLLESLEPEELDAVFGHEVGHVKHGHIPYYALFFVLSATATAGAVDAAAKAAVEVGYLSSQVWDGWVTLPPLAVMGGYIFLVFGFISRKCERQADVFGSRAAGIPAMVRALERVAYLNGMDSTTPARNPRGRLRGMRGLLRSWQHGTIGERIRFLLRLAENPSLESSFQWRVFALKCGLLAALAAAIGLLIWRVGWSELVRTL